MSRASEWAERLRAERARLQGVMEARPVEHQFFAGNMGFISIRVRDDGFPVLSSIVNGSVVSGSVSESNLDDFLLACSWALDTFSEVPNMPVAGEPQ